MSLAVPSGGRVLPDIGKQYDEIADWWNDYHQNSDYGVAALERALRIAGSSKLALDVGCGAGGRLIRKFEAQKYHITGIDASPRMIELARQNHRHLSFICADIIALGVTRNLEILHEHGMRLRHLELDQYPEKHAYIIAQKN